MYKTKYPKAKIVFPCAFHKILISFKTLWKILISLYKILVSLTKFIIYNTID